MRPEGGFGGPVITQYVVLVITQGEQGFRRGRLEFLRVLQRFSCCVAATTSAVKRPDVSERVATRKLRPGERELRVKLHSSLIKIDRFQDRIDRVGTYEKSQAAQVRL